MIAIVAAYSENRVLGKDGRIPWRIPGEQKRFRALTSGHTVIMGRRTYEEIGRPLPNRRNIVLTSTASFDGVTCVASLKEALALCGDDDVYLSGGASVYEAGLSICDVMYLTIVHTFCDGDTFFPVFNPEEFECTEQEDVDAEIPYTNLTFIRK